MLKHNLKHSMMQDNNFLEEISSIFTDSVKSSRIIIDQVRQIPFPKIDQDIRTVHPRGSNCLFYSS